MKFRALESWRGICAVGVVLFHINAASHFQTWKIIRNADLGVDFFFVLSGFVLAHAYSDRLRSPSVGVDFLIRRLGRLMPLHLFALAVLLCIEFVKLFLVINLHVASGDAPFSGSNSLVALVVSVLLLNGMSILPYFPWNGPSWSISTEFWMYLIFLMACLSGPRRYLYLIGLLFAASAGLLTILDATGIVLHTYQGLGILRCVHGFSAGALTYAVYRKMSLMSLAPHPLLESFAVAAMAALFFGAFAWSRVVAPWIFAPAILIFAFEKGPISWVLSTRLPLHVGLISYSIYLMHGPILAVFKALLRVSQSEFHHRFFTTGSDGEQLFSFQNVWVNDLVVALLIGAIMVVSTVTYRRIENPWRHYFNRLGKTATQHKGASADLQPASAKSSSSP